MGESEGEAGGGRWRARRNDPVTHPSRAPVGGDESKGGLQEPAQGFAIYRPRCIGMITCRKSSRPTGRTTPGAEAPEVSSATLGVSTTLKTSIK